MIELVLLLGFTALVITIHDAGAGITNALFEIAELLERTEVRRAAARDDREDEEAA